MDPNFQIGWSTKAKIFLYYLLEILIAGSIFLTALAVAFAMRWGAEAALVNTSPWHRGVVLAGIDWLQLATIVAAALWFLARLYSAFVSSVGFPLKPEATYELSSPTPIIRWTLPPKILHAIANSAGTKFALHTFGIVAVFVLVALGALGLQLVVGLVEKSGGSSFVISALILAKYSVLIADVAGFMVLLGMSTYRFVRHIYYSNEYDSNETIDVDTLGS